MAETDVLGAPYTAETIDLGTDEEGPVVATLVHAPVSIDQQGAVEEDFATAVFHVHGFADYFFQTEYAQWFDQMYDFYALDLRKYGRSLRPHQTPNYVTDLATHFEEIDAAWALVTQRDGHRRVLVSAHSTGALIMALWADLRRPPELSAMVLNSPWFDLRGAPWHRTIGTRVVDEVGARRPRTVVPREVSGLYARSLHRDHEGEWDFDLAWKPLLSWPVYAGWLRAVRRGHAAFHRGLHLDVPVLVLCSDRTTAPREMGEDVHTTDIVLDVEHIRRWAPALGSQHLTVVTIPGARHDVALSRPDVRQRLYGELSVWLNAQEGRTCRGLSSSA